jgi:hypothetical protein
LAGRVVLLLLAFILSLSVTQLVAMLFAGAAAVLPGVLGTAAAVGGFGLVRGLHYWICGVLFTLAVGMPWKHSALWTWLGIGLCDKLSAGPGAFTSGALAAQFTTVFGIVGVLITGAASFHSCWWTEQREHEPWAERGRAILLSFFNRGQ